MAGEIDMLDWIVAGIFAVGFLISLYLVVSVQGDLLVDDTKRGINNDEAATELFLHLIRETRKSIIIHDDGNNSPNSVYNNEKVMVALRDRIEKHGIQVKCLFNDAADQLALMDLAREFQNNVSIWHLDGERPTPDIHYKIVDDGKFVHLSEHEYDSRERKYVLRRADKWWAKGTRGRISKAYREQFDHGVKFGKRARIETPIAA